MEQNLTPNINTIIKTMILVSVYTEENLCEISIVHHLVKVNLSKKLMMKKNSHLRTIAIFAAIFKGILILVKRLVLSKMLAKIF